MKSLRNYIDLARTRPQSFPEREIETLLQHDGMAAAHRSTRWGTGRTIMTIITAFIGLATSLFFLVPMGENEIIDRSVKQGRTGQPALIGDLRDSGTTKSGDTRSLRRRVDSVKALERGDTGIARIKVGGRAMKPARANARQTTVTQTEDNVWVLSGDEATPTSMPSSQAAMVRGFDPDYGAYTLHNLTALNSKYIEYSPSISIDGTTLYFVSDRPAGQGGHDVWQASKTDPRSVDFGKPMPLPGGINTGQNEGVISISADGTTLYVTACNRPDGADCDIYFAVREGEGWSEMQRVPGINSDYWDAQPSISGSGDTLYFSSDRPDAMGMADNGDIYMAVRKEGGAWSEPVKLGSEINTSGREDSPYILPGTGKLYFASDGHGGEGGLDFFAAERTPTGDWTTPKNLGPVFNTPEHERFITVLPNEGVIYFASERKSPANLGQLDLFMAVLDSDVLSVPERKRFSLTAHPNPAEDYATVEALEDLTLPAEVILLDARGNSVRRERAVAFPHRVKVEGLPNGLYFVRIGDAVAPIVVRN